MVEKVKRPIWEWIVRPACGGVMGLASSHFLIGLGVPIDQWAQDAGKRVHIFMTTEQAGWAVSVIIGAAGLAIGGYWPQIKAWIVGQVRRSSNHDKRVAAHAPPIEQKPNWSTAQALELYITPSLGLTNEYDDIRKKETITLRLLTRQARAGKIRIWGKRIINDRPERDSREITAEEWLNRELLESACWPSAKELQTRSTIDPPAGYQYTDLHVNATEIKAIDWKSEWRLAST